MRGGERLVYGFDSFEGFPNPTKYDESQRQPKKGEYGDMSMARVLKMAEWAGVVPPTLVKGFFSDTLPHTPLKQIAFLNVDGDLYESTRDILENLYDKVVSGGVVALDDYRDDSWPGATKAVDDFLRERTIDASCIRTTPYFNHKPKYYFLKP